MNSTQRIKKEVMEELTKHVSLWEAEYFCAWLMSKYNIKEEK
jgi:hypothetical protein